MTSATSPIDLPGRRLPRLGVLLLWAAAIVGIGCGGNYYAGPDTSGETVLLPAARNGDARSQFQLAQAYRYGGAGLQRSDRDALSWMEKSAAGGYPQAQVALADAYLLGQLGLAQQPLTGRAWLQKAIDAGYAPALLRMADILRHGRGLPADPAQAAGLYEKLARQRLYTFMGAENLAQMLESGEGVPKNLVEAYAWYRMANDARAAERVRAGLTPEQGLAAEARYAQLRAEVRP